MYHPAPQSSDYRFSSKNQFIIRDHHSKALLIWRGHTQRFTTRVIKPVGSLQVDQHVDGPVQEVKQNQGQKETHPNAQGNQGVAIPFVAKSERKDKLLEIRSYLRVCRFVCTNWPIASLTFERWKTLKNIVTKYLRGALRLTSSFPPQFHLLR